MSNNMKFKEIKALSATELQERLQTETHKLQQLVFAHAITPIENPMFIRHTRRHIAQLKTAQQALKLEQA